LLKDYFDTGDLTRPYFEVLIVSDDPTPETSAPEVVPNYGSFGVRKIRFVYEAVHGAEFFERRHPRRGDECRSAGGGSSGTTSASNPNSMRRCCALIWPSTFLSNPVQWSRRITGVALARAIRKIRPELDVYLIIDGAVEKDGEPSRFQKTSGAVFYGIEDLMEIHLALMEGVNQRYDTPYFNKPEKTTRAVRSAPFHALPVARGKSVFNSHWIRDLRSLLRRQHFYG